MLPALVQISQQQSQPTTLTRDTCQQLMDYAHTYSQAKLHFYASDMILEIDSDASYLIQKYVVGMQYISVFLRVKILMMGDLLMGQYLLNVK